MDLIYYRGLNCYLASVVNIAKELGASYLDAYATLWSETDFTYEAKYNIYVSKRVFINLEADGVIIEAPNRGEIKPEEILSRVPAGEMLLIGMDTFYIPWHPVSGHFHDYHYFFAQKETSHSFLCFDPVYNEKYKAIKSSDILFAAFDLRHVYKIDAAPQGNRLTQEAKAVLCRHSAIKKQLLNKILECGGEERRGLDHLIKQVSAMINNRYLFRHFLCGGASSSGSYAQLFSDLYFSRWEAVRNGLYKASIVKDNQSVIGEIHVLFADLMNEEIAMAKEISTIPPDTWEL